jgi:hypothetical protein
MYRRSLAALWTGTIVFGVAATLDAFIDFMKNAQGALIAMFALMFIGAIMRMGFHELNETARANGGKAERVRADVEEKSQQLHNDVDQLRQQVENVTGTVDEVRQWQEADTLLEESKKLPEPDREPCPIYPLRLRDGRHEAIVGRRTGEPVDTGEILTFLEQNEAETLPGRHSAS